jgi:hypothetical protein
MSGEPHLDGYRSPEDKGRKPGDEPEPRHVPVDDSNDPAPLDAPAPAEAKDDAPALPKPPARPPFDDARARIGERFAKKRAEATLDFDGDINTDRARLGAIADDPPPDAAASNPDDKAPPKAGPSDSDDRFTLKVNHKDITKSIEEIAVLADMTVEEVRQEPARAQKYARMELATRERLENARRLEREARERNMNSEGDQPRSPAPPQERRQAGNQDADQAQDNDGDDPSAVDFRGLVDDLQVGTPEEVGEKLKDAFEKVAEKVTTRKLSQDDLNRRIADDGNTIRSGLLGFAQEHPEVKDNQELGPLMKGALTLEYKTDLRRALVETDGRDPDEVEEILRRATEEQIISAHQRRRVSGDPGVRKVDKMFFKAAYGRLRNLGSPDITEQRQDLAQQRQERKANLPPQPRRATVPPVTTGPAPTQVSSRKAAVAQLARARGQRAP